MALSFSKLIGRESRDSFKMVEKLTNLQIKINNMITWSEVWLTYK